MTITQERITPEQAKIYLGKNTDNYRKLNSNRVLTYAADMKNGKWQLNGEGIKFSKDGVLLDGQHRLQAIIKADTPAEMLVIRDIENDVDVYDIGSVRTLANIAQKKGTADGNYTTLVAIAAFIVANGDTHKLNGNVIILDYIDQHVEFLQKAHAATCSSSRPICRKAPIMAAVYCMIRDGMDLNDMMNFFRIANSGLPTGHYEPSPALIFRNTLADYKCRNTEERRMLFCITLAAVKDFLSGKVRTTKYRVNLNGFELLHKIRLEDGLCDK